MNIMIHACDDRMWYVNDFLVPSLLAQGIPKSSIKLWADTEHKGNLAGVVHGMRKASRQHLAPAG